MSSASGLQASDFSPLNSCLSNGFTSRGWTCGFKAMALKPLFSVKLYWDAILTPDIPSCLPSASFHPPAPPPAWGSLQQVATSSSVDLLCEHCQNSSHLPSRLMLSFPVYIHIVIISSWHLLPLLSTQHPHHTGRKRRQNKFG